MTQVVTAIISQFIDDAKKYLLVCSKQDFGKFTGLYYPPGGHFEKGENERMALQREIQEELNVKIIPIKRIAKTKADIKNQTTYWWLCNCDNYSFEVNTNELVDCRWMTREEILNSNKVWPATKSFFRKYISE